MRLVFHCYLVAMQHHGGLTNMCLMDQGRLHSLMREAVLCS
jgi:hypothetical protein